MQKGAFLVLALGLAPTAQAWQYAGNPDLTIWIERPEADITFAEGEVGWVRVHKCAGGYDEYDVSDIVDLDVGFEIAIDGGDFCSVQVEWTDIVEVQKGSTWSLEIDQTSTTVTLTGETEDEVDLDTYDVVSGTFSGNDPQLKVQIQ